MKRRSVLGLIMSCAALSVLGMASHPAGAQGKYPERTIRLVIPFAPGGENDIIGRIWAQKVASFLGGSIIADNRGGGGGSIGAAEVARAKPDGYTLLVGTTGTQIINPVAAKNPAYDPLKDFAAITLISGSSPSIALNPSVPAKTLQELIALIKASPGKFSYGSAGAGTFVHLTGELLRIRAGNIDLQHIPYKGNGPAIQDLIAGHIPMTVVILNSSVLAHHRAGRLRVITVLHEKRARTAPEIPTAVESGMPDMRAQLFSGIFAPAGTPQPVIDAVHQATVKAMSEGGLRKDLESAGAEAAVDSTPEKTARFVREETAKWTPIIRASGFRPD
ncbi:MAG: tripartite tricarboxylate transporter substrate binding protein [Betaproteobacteria bacterium]|nr:tripartite tricarboxylate transporter substrate binding protein [Betaproteobacteria bacterium]